MGQYKVYEIKQSIFKANDDAADVLRAEMKRDHCFLLNLMSSPGSGKTTLLRDLTRQMADTMSVQAALIDERGELAACVDGVPQLDVGASTDVLDGLPKTESVPWLIRSMAPNVIAMDELSGAEDAALTYALAQKPLVLLHPTELTTMCIGWPFRTG